MNGRGQQILSLRLCSKYVSISHKCTYYCRRLSLCSILADPGYSPSRIIGWVDQISLSGFLFFFIYYILLLLLLWFSVYMTFTVSFCPSQEERSHIYGSPCFFIFPKRVFEVFLTRFGSLTEDIKTVQPLEPSETNTIWFWALYKLNLKLPNCFDFKKKSSYSSWSNNTITCSKDRETGSINAAMAVGLSHMNINNRLTRMKFQCLSCWIPVRIWVD